MSNNLAGVQSNNIKTNEYWSHRLLEMIKLETSQFVFTKLGGEKELPKNQGTKTLSVRRYNSLPVSQDLSSELLAEGVAPTPLKVEAQRVDMNVDQYGAYIEETDWVDAIHMDDIKNIYQPELARHAAEVVERRIMQSFAEASEYFTANKASVDEYSASDTTYLTLQDVRMAALTMKNYRRQGHTKFGGKPVLVAHTNIIQDLLDDDKLEKKMLVPGQENFPIKNGSLQKYSAYGIYFVETLIADVTQNANAEPVNVYTSYLLGKNPYVVVKLGKGGIQWKTTGFDADSGDPLGQKATFGYKMWTGAKVIDPIAITRIYSVSNYDVVPASMDIYAETASQA